jgi:copper transport protein
VLLAPLASPAAALGHATLVRTEPREGAVVPRPPSQVVLDFDQQVKPVAGGIDVVDSSGRPVTSGAARNAPSDASTILIPLRGDLPDDDYTVRWEIVSTDGHLISGVFAFGVGTGRAPPQALPVSAASTQDWRYLTARALYFAGLLLLIGGAVFRLAVFLPSLGTAPEGGRRMMALRERHRANQVLAVAAAMALAGGWVALTLQGAAVAGVSFWSAFDHRGPVASALEATRFGRQFGRGIDVTAVFTVLVAVSYALAPQGRRLTYGLAVPTAAFGVWALAAPGISGHAGDPGRGALPIALDAVHVGAAAVWAGGLLQLAWVVPHATRGLPDGDRARVRTAIARRFSQIALGCVIALVASGVLRAVYELSAVSQLWTTSYGRVILAKVAVLGVLIAMGYRNRRMLDRFRDLRRSVIAELVLLAVVVGLVALLTNLPPGSTPSTASAGPSRTAQGGVATVKLRGGGSVTVWPGRAGPNAFAVRLPGVRGQATLLLQRSDGSAAEHPLERQRDGTYTVLVPDVPAGEVIAQVNAGAQTRAAAVQVGPRVRVPSIAPQPRATGPVAAGEAVDLAVGLQRLPGARARVTLLGRTGAAVDDAIVIVNGAAASPCDIGPVVCYEAPVPKRAARVAVAVQRVGAGPAKTTIELPATGSQPAGGIVKRTATATRALDSLSAVQVLASDPEHSVTTRFVVDAPDRLHTAVQGGLETIIIGDRRWDRQPGETWKESKTQPVKVPDPFWAARPLAPYVAAETASTVDVTLAYSTSDPVWFRLHVDRATGRVLQVHMVTAAHFMVETYGRFNAAPTVTPPVP